MPCSLLSDTNKSPLNAEPRVRHVVGCMTGTSLDGIDAALVRITGQGLDIKAEYLDLASQPFPAAFQQQLLQLANGNPAPPITYLRAARTLGVLHAQTIQNLLNPNPSSPKPQASSPTPPDFVVAHGQTIWHAPDDTLSWQLLDPWPIARHLNLPVCYDLRQADLIAGGQGAPITPLADHVLFKDKADAVLNLGGIANLTQLGQTPTDLTGCDLCPCNLLLDGLTQRLFPGLAFDQNGDIARTGKPEPKHFDTIFATYQDPTPHRSLGRENITADQLDTLIAKLVPALKPTDILASAVEAIAQTIATRIASPNTLALAGGGTHNTYLVERITRHTTATVTTTDALGIPVQAREAVAFAVLGTLSQDRIPITLPQVTGSTNPGIAGTWLYP